MFAAVVSFQVFRSELEAVTAFPLLSRPTTAHWLTAGHDRAAMAETPCGEAIDAQVVPPSLDSKKGALLLALALAPPATHCVGPAQLI